MLLTAMMMVFDCGELMNRSVDGAQTLALLNSNYDVSCILIGEKPGERKIFKTSLVLWNTL
jgi:hypothetical protein